MLVCLQVVELGRENKTLREGLAAAQQVQAQALSLLCSSYFTLPRRAHMKEWANGADHAMACAHAW